MYTNRQMDVESQFPNMCGIDVIHPEIQEL